MAYKHVTAIALGTVATSVGIMHFDPKRDDEDGRYQHRILPDTDAEKARKRGLVEVDGDVSEAEFKAQQAGVSARPAEAAAQRIADMGEAPVGGAGGSAPATAIGRNFPNGQGPAATNFDPDAAPGGSTQPAILDQSIAKLTASLKDVTDPAELDRLHGAEESHQNRDGALKAIDERKKELAAG